MNGPLIQPPRGERNWRRHLLHVLLFGMAGLLAELYLLDHYQGRAQWIPVALLVAGIVGGGWLAARPSAFAVRALRAVVAAYVPAGLLGVYFHVRSNVEFELEVHPDASGLDLAAEGLTGAMPSLAPGAMILLGMLGMLLLTRHPALRRSEPDARGGDPERDDREEPGDREPGRALRPCLTNRR